MPTQLPTHAKRNLSLGSHLASPRRGEHVSVLALPAARLRDPRHLRLPGEQARGNGVTGQDAALDMVLCELLPLGRLLGDVGLALPALHGGGGPLRCGGRRLGLFNLEVSLLLRVLRLNKLAGHKLTASVLCDGNKMKER